MDHSPPVSIPRLLTPRLLLREYRMPDFDAYAAHLADPAATSLIGAIDRKTAWRMFGCQVGSWTLQGAGWWAVETRDGGEFVGTVGAFFREGSSEIEIGWNTHRAFRRRGFASEAAGEAIRYALEDRGEKRVIALVEPSNASSLRVAAHVGLAYEADVELWGRSVGRYARTR